MPMNLDKAHIGAYLAHRLGRAVQVLELQALDTSADAASGNRGDLKVYGYGHPILIHYQINGIERRAVLRTMASNPFGHERRADRAAGLLLSYDTFNDLERHVRALDLGVLRADGQLASLDP